MKVKKNKESAKSLRKPNLPLRRKMRVYTEKVILGLKILVFILICLFFTKYLNPLKQWLAHHVYEYSADTGFRLEKVIVEGQKNILTDDIVSTLNADVGTSILSIPLDEVRVSLSKNEWVSDVVLERRLPNTIYISITERMPIAILQQNKKLYLVDDDAHIIHCSNIEKFAGLLHVVGSDAHLHASALLSDLNSDPLLQKKIISAVRYGERRWNFIFDQGITVRMPETDFMKAYKYLSDLNQKNGLFDKNIKYIDLRSSEKGYCEYYPEVKEDKKINKNK